MEGKVKVYVFLILGIMLMLTLFVVSSNIRKNMTGLASGKCLYADQTMGYICPCDEYNAYDSELVKDGCAEDMAG